MLIPTWLRGALYGATAVGLTACAVAPEPIVIGDAGPITTIDSGLPLVDGGSCETGDVLPCECSPGVSGSRSCFGGQYLLCNCLSVPDSGPIDTSGSCKGGYYEGTFQGEYRSGFAFGLPIDVEALDLLGGQGLAFVLEEKESVNGEFYSYEISDGFVKGTANGLFPFEAKLTGTLDCNTKKFTGALEGCYSVFVDLFGLNTGYFQGPVYGEYDGNQFVFTAGTWDLAEPGNIFANAGGNGVWDAAWTADAPPDTGILNSGTGCSANIPDGGLAQDASTGATTDAGI